MFTIQTTFNAIALRGALAFGAPTAVILIFVHGPIKGLLLGAGSGLLFGVCLSFVNLRHFKAFNSQHKMVQDEPVIKRVMANHIVKRESRSGQMLLTENWVGFRAHESNFNRSPIDIPFHGIVKVETAKSMIWISNRLKITIINGMTLEFIVWESKEWAQAIQKKLIN